MRRKKDKNMYRFAADDGGGRRDMRLKWLTCVPFSVEQMFRAGVEQMDRTRTWMDGVLWSTLYSLQLRRTYGYKFVAGIRKRGVKKCRKTDVLVFFKPFYSSTASRDVCYIRRVFCCSWLKFLCDFEVWVVLMRCHSFYGISDVVDFTAVENVEQLLERP